MNPNLQLSGLSLSGPDLTDLLRAVLARGAAFRFKTKGFSMNPFIKDGDIVTVCPLGPTSICRGDIVAFTHYETGPLFIHRVLEAQDDSFLIKGDNAARSDGLIHASQVLGRITKIERNGRSIRLGLGCERRLIAFFARNCFLPTLLKPARRIYWIFVPKAEGG